MGLRVDIQARLIALFKVNTFEIVKYDDSGVPSVGHGTETPRVECNEISSSMSVDKGQSDKYSLKNWTFDIICSFVAEVDFSDFISSLSNMSFVYGNDVQVNIEIGNTVIVQHPPRQGASNGTELRFNINVNTRR